jgi:hypothetical protein
MKLDAIIAETEERLKALRRLRKSIRSRERLKAQRESKAFMERQRAGHAAMFSDPERRAHKRQRQQEGFMKSARYVPWPKGTPQRALYARLLRHGVPRDQALQEAGK